MRQACDGERVRDELSPADEMAARDELQVGRRHRPLVRRDELLHEEHVAAAAQPHGGQEIRGGLLGTAADGDPVARVGARHESLEHGAKPLARDALEAAGSEREVESVERIIGRAVGLDAAQDGGDLGVHTRDAQVDAPDDVATGARDRHTLRAALVPDDGVHDRAQETLVGLARLGRASPQRAALPQRGEAQQVCERLPELASVERLRGLAHLVPRSLAQAPRRGNVEVAPLRGHFRGHSSASPARPAP